MLLYNLKACVLANDLSCLATTCTLFMALFSSFFFHTHLLSSSWTSRGHRRRPFSPPVLAFNFIAHRVQQSHCSSIFHRVLLTHALALSATQFLHKKKSQEVFTSMHSGGFELTKLTYTRLEDNLIRHWGDRQLISLQDSRQRCPCSSGVWSASCVRTRHFFVEPGVAYDASTAAGW